MASQKSLVNSSMGRLPSISSSTNKIMGQTARGIEAPLDPAGQGKNEVQGKETVVYICERGALLVGRPSGRLRASARALIVVTYRRRLPHWHPDGAALFLTFRLHGSLPSQRFFPAGNQNAGRVFVAMDRLLDNARTGPFYLARPEIACLVVEALKAGQDTLDHYDLHAFVMPQSRSHANHAQGRGPENSCSN